MKLRSISATNLKSFREPTTVAFNSDYSILVGPNGGGKSNLLDIITIGLRAFLLHSVRLEQRPGGSRTIERFQPFSPPNHYLEKFSGETRISALDFELEVTSQDVDNVRIILEKRDHLLAERQRYASAPDLDFLQHWTGVLKAGESIQFSIHDSAVTVPSVGSPEFTYYSYLQNLEYLVVLGRGVLGGQIKPVFLPIPAYRAVDAGQFRTTLSAWQDHLGGYFSTTSQRGSSFIGIAAQYFASRRRQYEANGIVGAFAEDAEVTAVTRYLDSLGYGWLLYPINPMDNTYEIRITRGGKDFSVTQASSGEREFLNFVFGIFAIGINGGLILVDEPELHLHPQWQRDLLRLFIEIHASTGNQFVLTTHSPAFITPATIGNVRRVYFDGTSSRTIALAKSAISEARDLLHLITSHNNEKMFFADRVVLVEGPSDRLVLSELIKRELCRRLRNDVIEVLEVYGKQNFKKYQDLLGQLGVRHLVIADRDYLLDVGGPEMSKLAVTHHSKIDKTIKRRKSQDRQTLSEALGEAIRAQRLDRLKEIYEYLCQRVSRFKQPLSPEEEAQVEQALVRLRATGVFILARGEIENYLPADARSLDSIIELTRREGFLEILTKCGTGTEELLKIVYDVVA